MNARIYANFPTADTAEHAASVLRQNVIGIRSLEITPHNLLKKPSAYNANIDLYPSSRRTQNDSWPLNHPVGSVVQSQSIPMSVLVRKTEHPIMLMVETDSRSARQAACILSDHGGRGVSIF